MRQVLADLLGADSTTALHGAGAVGVGGGLSSIGLGLGHSGTRNGDVRLYALRGKCGQHLAALDRVSHIGAQLGHAQAIGLGTDAGFLPGGHATVGCQLDRQHAALGLDQRHRERGFGHRAGLGRVRRVAACGEQGQRGQHQ